jgi:hypothetical protein
MQLDTYLAQVLNPILAVSLPLKKESNVGHSFEQTLTQSVADPQSQMIEIGEGKYKIEALSQSIEKKNADEYQKMQTSPQTTTAEPDQKDSQSSSTQVAQFLIHPIYQGVRIHNTTPALKAFIKQAALSIKSLPLKSGAHQYQFQFKEPPLSVVFETQNQTIKITIKAKEISAGAISEIKDHQKELIAQLKTIFKEHELNFEIDIEDTNAQSNSQDNQQNSQNSHSQSQETSTSTDTGEAV